MEMKTKIIGIQHVGIPTNDIGKSMQFYRSLFICNPNNRAIIFHSDKFFYLCNQGVEEEIGSAEEQPISNKLLDDMQ